MTRGVRSSMVMTDVPTSFHCPPSNLNSSEDFACCSCPRSSVQLPSRLLGKWFVLGLDLIIVIIVVLVLIVVTTARNIVIVIVITTATINCHYCYWLPSLLLLSVHDNSYGQKPYISNLYILFFVVFFFLLLLLLLLLPLPLPLPLLRLRRRVLLLTTNYYILTANC